MTDPLLASAFVEGSIKPNHPQMPQHFTDQAHSRMYWRGRDLYLGLIKVGFYFRDDKADDLICFVAFASHQERPVTSCGSAVDAKFALECAILSAIDYIA